MACSGAFSSAQDYADFWCFSCLDQDEENVINRALSLAASDVHSHMAAVGACDCTLAAWATEYLKKVNIIDAAVVYNCRCASKLTAEEKRMWLEWLDRQFALIREGKIELCSGATGSDWPVIGWAEQSLTEQNAAVIIANAVQKGS